ncbi:deoxyribodipyrimidine photo-lyase [Christiangramia sp. SM2212]|uniref:Deoxyribodipyrimidine photo-lyase n=1 Tax=Christiangramia sediminicola TaxID=3073267 RepID=A0ABU1EQG2_9FLAO|nr:deoxyribodipyrimidine photo-lyase [Christiangramia sp. SM2212]MDR5590443.1 deoxyribodipyrimidine photo-lyase [Christiangramia sp. SM2212]
MSKKVNIFWFRRDLRLDDNAGLKAALQDEHPVLPIFIFDPEILDKLPEDDARVTFIFGELQKMRDELQKEHGSSIAMFHDEPEKVFKSLIKDYKIEKVFTNRDYEPYAKDRDEKISKLLSDEDIEFLDFKDQVIFEKDEVVKSDGDPYVVYTPYKNLWREKFSNTELDFHYTTRYMDNLYDNSRLPNLSLSDIGFKKSSLKVPDYKLTPGLIKDYKDKRDYPAVHGTSRLGPHLRFGTVSVRQMVRDADKQRNKTFLDELVWREFFMQILFHFPDTVTDAFKKKYDRIKWRNNKDEFELWKQGKTGYPLVDAGMRQLNESGFMHNRIRMLVGSFLCKHLLIDWRWGEAYFAEKLLDYEMSSNVGNWQWVAGSGVDAAPYFRIFNPTTQIEKFDKDEEYIKEWVSEYGSDDYPEKMVDHKEARERALKTYKEAVSN